MKRVARAFSAIAFPAGTTCFTFAWRKSKSSNSENSVAPSRLFEKLFAFLETPERLCVNIASKICVNGCEF